MLQWATVSVSQTLSELSYLFGHVLADLRTRPDPMNALPLSAAIVERSSYYKASFRIDTPVPLDKSLMHSEAARLASFNNWPHGDYRLDNYLHLSLSEVSVIAYLVVILIILAFSNLTLCCNMVLISQANFLTLFYTIH